MQRENKTHKSAQVEGENEKTMTFKVLIQISAFDAFKSNATLGNRK
jgi:hypothetical protein